MFAVGLILFKGLKKLNVAK